MVELGTPVCHTLDQLKEELSNQRRFIVGLAEHKGLAVAAAATHPFSHWQEQLVTPLPRYQGVLEEMQLLAQRLLIFGMHVHVGIEDRAFAIDTMNVVRYMLPHTLALSTTAPSGRDARQGSKAIAR